MPEKLTLKDRFERLMKTRAKIYTKKLTPSKVFCRGVHYFIFKAYAAGARYGWKKHGEMRGW